MYADDVDNVELLSWTPQGLHQLIDSMQDLCQRRIVGLTIMAWPLHFELVLLVWLASWLFEEQ